MLVLMLCFTLNFRNMNLVSRSDSANEWLTAEFLDPVSQKGDPLGSCMLVTYCLFCSIAQ